MSHLGNWMNYLFVLVRSKRCKYRAGFKACEQEDIHCFGGLSLLRMLDFRLPYGPSSLLYRLTRGGSQDREETELEHLGALSQLKMLLS